MIEYPLCQRMKPYVSQYQVDEDKRSLEFSPIIIHIISILELFFVIIVVSSLFVRSSLSAYTQVLFSMNTVHTMLITVSTVIVSTLLTAFIGIPTAFSFLNKGNRWYSIMNGILSVPIFLPPSIAGLALLMSLGRRGIVGAVLSNFNIYIPFTFFAVVIAQIFVASPLFIQCLKDRFMSIDISIKEAALICGAGYKELLIYIYLPMSKKALFTGITMSMLRALGEFGATMMFAGNLSGKTQTLSTLIYTYAQQNTGQAVTLAGIHILFFLLPVLCANLFFCNE